MRIGLHHEAMSPHHGVVTPNEVLGWPDTAIMVNDSIPGVQGLLGGQTHDGDLQTVEAGGLCCSWHTACVTLLIRVEGCVRHVSLFTTTQQ